MCTHHARPARSLLTELHYKDVMQEIVPTAAGTPNPKLPYRDWSALIPFVKYEGYRKDTFKFNVPAKYNSWNVYLKFDEFYEQVADRSVNANEASRLLFWGGNIRWHCNCPAYAFYMSYLATQLDVAIFPETRFPHVRNPHLKGVGACKHAIRTLKVLPFHLGDIAKAVKEQRLHGPEQPVPLPPQE